MDTTTIEIVLLVAQTLFKMSLAIIAMIISIITMFVFYGIRIYLLFPKK